MLPNHTRLASTSKQLWLAPALGLRVSIQVQYPNSVSEMTVRRVCKSRSLEPATALPALTMRAWHKKHRRSWRSVQKKKNTLSELTLSMQADRMRWHFYCSQDVARLKAQLAMCTMQERWVCAFGLKCGQSNKEVANTTVRHVW